MLKFECILFGWAIACNCFTPPEISFLHLQSVSMADYVRSTLSHTGMLAITDVPQLAMTRQKALSDIAWCLSSKSKQNNEVKASMPDGTVRRTLLLKDGFEPLPYCPEIQPELELLRHLVEMTANSVAMSLDLAKIHINVEMKNGNILTSMSQVVGQAKRLDHFHLYEGNSTTQSSTLPMHVDAGIFIAFVPPLWKGQKSKKDNSGLLVQLPNGKIESVLLNKNSVVIMVGLGAQKFLNLPLHPVPHSLHVQSGTFRSWYGQMILLPEDALVGDSKMITFSKFWSNAHEEIGSGLGCSLSSKKLLGKDFELIDVSDPPCPMGTMDCWSMSPGNICLKDISCPSGIEPICMAGESGMGPHLCTKASDCKLKCNGTVPTPAWCMGGTDMYMDGFNFAADSNMCTMLFFSIFTLNTPWKLFWGCLIIFLLGLCWPSVNANIKYLNKHEKMKHKQIKEKKIR